MRIVVKVGDVLDERVDVLVSTANVQLNMSGGVNGAILLRGGESVQAELHEHLRATGRRWIAPGEVVVTGPGPLNVGCIVHAVAVDAFYGSSVEVVRTALENALAEAARRNARTVATPALATGYGPLTMDDFATALAPLKGRAFPPVEELRVVLRREDDAARVREILDSPPDGR
jgi:O-acetyl-ADP-ribose deacetylase (regulator of RNase III)